MKQSESDKLSSESESERLRFSVARFERFNGVQFRIFFTVFLNLDLLT